MTPGSVLFIDDTTVNIHAAERLGMHTHQFTEPAGTAQAISRVRPGWPRSDARL
ncbi:hypothetical protein [Micromonospora sp. DT62]|uniref:hypothetical protein n=1 Tax=Micromonospora sp. DT62 TaxID=3416521 RepID=UPI003CE7421B